MRVQVCGMASIVWVGGVVWHIGLASESLQSVSGSTGPSGSPGWRCCLHHGLRCHQSLWWAMPSHARLAVLAASWAVMLQGPVVLLPDCLYSLQEGL